MSAKSPNSDSIRAISRAISIVDDYTFNVFDQQFHVPYQQPYQKWDQPLQNFGQNTGEKKQLMANLASQLYGLIYGAFYVKGSVEKANLANWQHGALTQDDIGRAFVDELSAHNRTVPGVDYSWKIYALDPQGNAFVEKNGDIRQLQTGSYDFANPKDTQAAVNVMVNLKQPKEHRDLQPTFYHVNSQELMPIGEEFGRFYWNIEADGAKYLIEQITAVFNQYGVPFMFKCNNHPELYNRSDGAVLYTLRKQFHIVSRLLRIIVPKVKPFLKREVPLFSLRLADGLSYAEDPGMNQSFGMSRSQLVAKGIVQAYERKRNSANAQYKEILEVFKQNGLDVKQPHLRPNSHWEYDFTFLEQQ